MQDTHLFSSFTLKGLVLKNRIAVSPMCQYSSKEGFPTDWHFVHLGSRAVGGAALVMTEATAITPEGRISPQDLGIWLDDHVKALAPIVRFIEEHGAVAGMQLAHAGRKGSTRSPLVKGNITVLPEEGGWQPVAPSALVFGQDYPLPAELSCDEIARIVEAFALAAKRAYQAGFRVVEIHSAHGYLLHEFLSPLSNQRHDQYGGTFNNRIRLLIEVVKAIRQVWPKECPLFVRISATDWAEGGWSIEDSIELSRRLKSHEVDLIDTSSGALIPHVKIPTGPGYQTRFAQRIRHEAQIATGAVGMITSPTQADHIIRTGQADMVLLAREMLRDPYWPLRAARELGHSVIWPVQYRGAAPRTL